MVTCGDPAAPAGRLDSSSPVTAAVRPRRRTCPGRMADFTAAPNEDGLLAVFATYARLPARPRVTPPPYLQLPTCWCCPPRISNCPHPGLARRVSRTAH